MAGGVTSENVVENDAMDLFQLGDFTLNSGAKAAWKLECDALTEGDIRALAKMISLLVAPFDSVEGVPRGGLALAVALAQYRTPGSERHLLVDDVLTTGGSMSRAREQYRLAHAASKEVIGAVVFARGKRPWWISAVFQMPEVFWVKPKE